VRHDAEGDEFRAGGRHVTEMTSFAEFHSVLRLYASNDPTGVEIGGSIKNVVAIGAGVLHGLGLGHNAMAALITRGLAEMTRLAVAMGGRPQTLGRQKRRSCARRSRLCSWPPSGKISSASRSSVRCTVAARWMSASARRHRMSTSRRIVPSPVHGASTSGRPGRARR
jgi:hypothetical protein